MDEVVYTPERLRAMAGVVYRHGTAFGASEMREVGNYLSACARASDEEGDILQQRNAAKAELARLQGAVAELDAQRIRADAADREAAELRGKVALLTAERKAIAGELAEAAVTLRGQSLWYRLAMDFVEDIRDLIPVDRQSLISPMSAAPMGYSVVESLREAVAHLRKAIGCASLWADANNDRAARKVIEEAEDFLESERCRKFSRLNKS